MSATRREVLRFVLAGMVGLMADVAVLYLMRAAGAGWYVGRAMSFLTAVWVTWQINRRYTFVAAPLGSPWREWWRYLAAMAGGGAINYGVFSATIVWLAHVPLLPLVAVAFGSLAGMTVNFLSAKLFVFRPPS